MENQKLFMCLLGCTPKGRHTEQHDVFFGIASTVQDLIPDFYKFWPEAKEKIHLDAWREVTQVDNFKVEVLLREDHPQQLQENPRLFFINLGGYKKKEFDEFHYKMLIAAKDKGIAIRNSKETAFYKHMGFKGATSHIDDKYGVDVDDVHEISDILPKDMKDKYFLKLIPDTSSSEDELHLGYMPLHKF
jgi:hypothetical protein